MTIERKLGKAPARRDTRTLVLSDYTDRRSLLPAAPPSRDWNDKLPADLGMMGNDQAGCCGFAGLGHAVMTWSSQHGALVQPTTAEIFAWYTACTGYNPNDPSTDNGVVLLDALKWARQQGLIFGFVAVDVHSLALLALAINLFGGTYLGFQLPLSAQADGPWIGKTGPLTGNDAPGSWGGHCTWTAKYASTLPQAAQTIAVDASAIIDFETVTWGERKPSDHQFMLDYCDEAYALLSPKWADTNIVAPNGFDIAALRNDLANIH